MKLRGWVLLAGGAGLATAAIAMVPPLVAPSAEGGGSALVQARQPAGPQPRPHPGAPRPANPRASYRVVGVGDIMMGSDWPDDGLDLRITPTADPAQLLGPQITERFRAADVVFGNFEGTIHTSSANAKQCGNPRLCFTFRSPPFHAAYLRRAGFTLVSNANNHSRDFGEPGRAETYRNLAAAGLIVSGADTPSTRVGVQTLADGTRFALVAFGHNPGLLQVNDLARLTQLVREAGQQSEVVVVSCHIGGEGARNDRVTRATEMFVGEDRGDPFRFARTAIDAGADIVFCHGPHVPRAVDVYRGRFIAYSLGNFWTYGRFNLRDTSGLAPVADLEVARDGTLVSARIVSARQDRPGGPVFDPGHAAARQIAMLTARDFPETGVSVAADGTVSWRR